MERVSIKMNSFDEASYKSFRVRWSDLQYAIDAKSCGGTVSKSSYPVFNQRLILDNINGSAESGELTAIMGKVARIVANVSTVITFP